MKKMTIAAWLVLSGLVSVSSAARADDFSCTINTVAERPSGPGAHRFAFACTNGRGAISPTTADAAVTERFANFIMAAFLANRSIYVDLGPSCSLATDCPAVGYAMQ